MIRRVIVSATAVVVVCGCGGNQAATHTATQRTPAAAATTAPRQSHGYRLVGSGFAIREPHDNGTVSYQVRFRINQRPPADRAGGPRLHVDLAGEGPETAPGRVGLKTKWRYASEIANDYKTIPANAKTLALTIRVGTIAGHTLIGEQARVVSLGRSFVSAYRTLGCKA
jgi:hypothetical protein